MDPKNGIFEKKKTLKSEKCESSRKFEFYEKGQNGNFGQNPKFF